MKAPYVDTYTCYCMSDVNYELHDSKVALLCDVAAMENRASKGKMIPRVLLAGQDGSLELHGICNPCPQ